MPFLPQLSTGAMSQYPLRRKQVFRTAVNRMMDGRRIKAFDPGASRFEFELPFEGLSDAEADALEAFFVEQEGRRNSFGFLDPASNLLRWSEDFSNAVWTLSPLVSLQTGISDPWGTSRASRLTNAAGIAQGMQQPITAPGGYRYAFSVWMRALVPTTVDLVATSGSSTGRKSIQVGADWSRQMMSVALSSTAEEIRFGWELAAGATVEAVGAQVDAQPAPAGYRKSTSRSGVYPKVRFAMDTFSRVARGPNDHSTVIKIIARVA